MCVRLFMHIVYVQSYTHSIHCPHMHGPSLRRVQVVMRRRLEYACVLPTMLSCSGGMLPRSLLLRRKWMPAGRARCEAT